MSEDNLKLWNEVCNTDPKFTKNVHDRGRNYTDIDPMWLIRKATEMWGPMGSTWGLKSLTTNYIPFPADPLAEKITNRYCVRTFEFYYPGGSFEIMNEMPLFSAKQGLYDNDWAKKLETNTLSKALSRLGFGADVFLGMFDDSRYVAAMNEKFAEETPRVTDDQVLVLEKLITETKTAMDEFLAAFGLKSIADMPADTYNHAKTLLDRKKAKMSHA